MIGAPHTYIEWVTALNLLAEKTHDQELLPVLQKGTIQWQSGVAERFSSKFMDVINNRLNTAIDKFQKELSRSRGYEGEFVQAILLLRKELSFLANVTNLPAIPEAVRSQFRDLVLDQANKLQGSLESSAKADRSGKLASIIRTHRLDHI